MDIKEKLQKVDWKDFIIRALVSILGITLISLGAALSGSMSMGLDPFTALNTGASELLGFSLGNFQLVVNLIILVIIFFIDRSQLGWGTIFNMILVGYQIQFFTGLLESFLSPDDLSMVFKLLITLAAIVIFTFGVAVYKDAKLGVSPYDAIAPIVSDKTGWRYRYARISQDIIVVAGAFFLSGPLGVTTFITGFVAGPFIEFFSDKVTMPIMEKLSPEIAEEEEEDDEA